MRVQRGSRAADSAHLHVGGVVAQVAAG